MRSILLNARALSCLVDLLKDQIASMELQRGSLGVEEGDDDQRSDLNNDIGYMVSLLGHLEHELRLDGGG
jgi:hypothetical protein